MRESSPVSGDSTIEIQRVTTKTADRKVYGSRYIPRAMMRIVYERDIGKCRCCSNTSNLNIDHIVHLGRGGKTAAENLRLLCFSCNQRAAIRVFGVAGVEAKITERKRSKSFEIIKA